MGMGSLLVVRPGLQTTVQDLGRWGFQSRGVPVAGAMDPFACRLANALVGNRPDDACLEVTLSGPLLQFDDERVIAVTGAEFAMTVDGTVVDPGCPFRVARGSRLTFGARQNGARAFVAVAGGLGVPPVLGSRSTHLPTKMGGWFGRQLETDDLLPLGPVLPSRPQHRSVPTHRPSPANPPDPIHTTPTRDSGPVVVRFLPGPQQHYFQDDAIAILQSAPYLVTAESNRMGFRLQGPRLGHARGADIVSDATALGSLQVPSSGQPILLMADRQTTGGYPKLATVITADLALVAQLAPGDQFRFEACTPPDALTALIARERAVLVVERDGS
jgi:antagonist of KipI